jgi:hypothetical protein
MTFDPRDFRATFEPVATPAQPDIEAVIKTVLTSVFFCVYDHRKVEDIIQMVNKDLREQHNMELSVFVQWNPPSVNIVSI